MSTRPRGLIIAIEQYNPQGQIPTQLAGTKKTAEAFRKWLVEKKGVQDEDIVTLVSDTFPASQTTKPEIAKKISSLQLAWQEQADELYVFISGHGISQKETSWPNDYFITSDFESFEFSGDAMIPVQALQRVLSRALGPGTHYYFIDVCRTELPPEEVEPGKLGVTEKKANNAEAAYLALFSTRTGATADVKSEFGAAIVDGLGGKGRAKQWEQDKLFVTWDKLEEYVQARIEPQEIEPASRGKGVKRILRVEPVVNSPCDIEVVDAEADDEFDVKVIDVKTHATLQTETFRGTKHHLDLRPDDYVIEVTNAGEPLERIEPPEGNVDLYDACTVKFRKHTAAPGGAVPAMLEVHVPEAATARITEAGSGETYTIEGPEFSLTSVESYSIEMLDRGVVTERVRRTLSPGERAELTLGAPRRTRAHEAIRRKVDLSKTVGPVISQDLTLWLTLLGASRVVRNSGAYPDINALKLRKFEDVKRGASPTYVLAGFEKDKPSSAIAGGTKLTKIKGLPNVLHARLDTKPGPSLLELAFPEAKTELTIATHALPNRVTLVVVVHGDDGRWYVRQLLLAVEKYLGNMPAPVREFFQANDPLKTVYAIAQAQTLFTRAHEIKEAFDDSFWDGLLYGKWLDPVVSLMACYELLRRGTMQEGSLREVLRNLRLYFPELADTEAIARIARMPWTPPPGMPMFLDGAMAMPETLEERRGTQVLDYRAPWTMWIGPMRKR